MQLNSKTTHEIIKIDKIDPNQNLIVYSVYEKNEGILLSQQSIVCDIDLKQKLKECVNFYQLAYDILSKKFKDFEVSNDEQNWKIPDRPIRLIIPQKLINQALLEQNDFNSLILRELKNNAQAKEKFIYQSKNIAIAYYSQIDNNDANIIQPLIDTGEIILETKKSANEQN